MVNLNQSSFYIINNFYCKACKNGNKPIAEVLISMNASLDIQDNNGDTALIAGI